MKKKLVYLIFSIAMTLLGFILIFSPFISDSTAFKIGQPLFYGFLPLIAYFIVLLFFDLDRIKYQYKLFNYYLIASIILVFLTPINCRDPLNLCFDKQKISITLSIVFILVSIIYTTVQFFKNKKNNQEKPEKNYFI